MGDVTYRHVFLSNDTTTDALGPGAHLPLAAEDATDDSLLGHLARGGSMKAPVDSPYARQEVLFRQASLHFGSSRQCHLPLSKEVILYKLWLHWQFCDHLSSGHAAFAGLRVLCSFGEM